MLIYNGWNEEHVHKTGWVIFSKENPTEILARCEEPILESTKDWEGHGPVYRKHCGIQWYLVSTLWRHGQSHRCGYLSRVNY
ncbi:MAG: hypothetical protein IID16_09765 [Candidatus Marinimicrobia bacterium]|nr:hypothetical protein [Candidatus Neomarinimicrobiota bacterium]